MVEAKNKWKAWVYLAPALILLAVFTVYPLIKTFIMCFLEGYDPLDVEADFSFGFGNFSKVISYVGFKNCMKNTLLLCVLTVPISCGLALLIAVFLNSIPKFSRFFQTIYFLPYVTNSIAIGMVFMTMFNIIGLQPANDYSGDLTIYHIKVVGDETSTREPYVAQSWGIINNFLQVFGLNPIDWVNQRSTYAANITVMVIYIVWNALPFKILILLGGLQSVNKQYYDAAKIDGASRSTIFFRITVPLLSPMIAYVVITGFIGGFKEYSSIVGVFGDTMGPTGDSKRLNTMVGFIYDALTNTQYGTASAASLILFGIILVVTLLNLYVSNKKVHY